MTEQSEQTTTPAVESADIPAPEWDDDFGEWGRWMPDPDVRGDEVWVAIEGDVRADHAEKASRAEAMEAPIAAQRRSESESVEPFSMKWADGREAKRPCAAHKTNGDPCRKQALAGMTVCRTHGGATSHVKNKARVRLEMAADRMVKELLGIALNEKVTPYVRLESIKTALDRAGIGAKQAVEVEVGPAKGWEQVFSGIAGGSREESRAARGTGQGGADPFAAHRAMYEAEARTQQALDAADAVAHENAQIVDAEVVDAEQQDQPAKLPRPHAGDGVATVSDAAQFIKEANARAAGTKPRHT